MIRSRSEEQNIRAKDLEVQRIEKLLSKVFFLKNSNSYSLYVLQ